MTSNTFIKYNSAFMALSLERIINVILTQMAHCANSNVKSVVDCYDVISSDFVRFHPFSDGRKHSRLTLCSCDTLI